jgi:phospho-N-acetylmuramoyl-pentapeptide-transferase
VRAVLIAATVGFLFSIFGTRYLIGILVRRGYGQFIRDDGPQTHHVKRGTPTMGGAIFIAGGWFAYGVSHLVTGTPPTVSALLVLGLMTGLGFVGFLDDFLKVSRQRSLGLRARSKLIGQGAVGISFALLGLQFADERGFTPISQNLSIVRDTGLRMAVVLVVVWVLFMITATSNGVNLTDGLDGLATGASVMTFAAYVLIGIWEFGQRCTDVVSRTCYTVRDPLDLAIVAAALMGTCFGFLWWNAHPAKIIMGDTGSLALGGALAGLAITTRTQLLLVFLGLLFVIITLSVILQVGYFKLTRGKRLFRMAPLQHHFELLGWGEVTIVIRFWIIAGIGVAAGLGLFYAAWVVPQ